VVSELDRKPIGRPWLTLVIDVASRMIAGFHLSLDSPSSASVALAISHAVLPKQKFLPNLNWLQTSQWRVYRRLSTLTTRRNSTVRRLREAATSTEFS
jgi:putative transposase